MCVDMCVVYMFSLCMHVVSWCTCAPAPPLDWTQLLANGTSSSDHYLRGTCSSIHRQFVSFSGAVLWPYFSLCFCSYLVTRLCLRFFIPRAKLGLTLPSTYFSALFVSRQKKM
uniref:Secreted protein n=1 Tax=Oryzias melastigma TaxID=30732 RepID=A0A3B3C0S0_ORYME